MAAVFDVLRAYLQERAAFMDAEFAFIEKLFVPLRWCTMGLVVMEIRVDDLTGPEIAAFLEEHIRDMRSVSPPESKHALDLEGLQKPEITFWTVWDDHQLVGCGAIKELDPSHGEIKSMRTSSSHRRKGVAAFVLQHILMVARERGYRRVSLETGSMPFFEPARRLYTSHGFEDCAPFANYREDPNSVFFTKDLTRS